MNEKFLDFFQPAIYAYLILGAPEENYRRAQRALADFGVKKYQMIDLFQELEKQSVVSIAEIRQLRRRVRVKPLSRQGKIYIFFNGQKMSRQAQNSLLKLLEEPPPFLRFLIFCQDKKNILPTIASRCLIVQRPVRLKINAGLDKFPPIEELSLKELFALAEKLSQTDVLKVIDNWLIFLYQQDRKKRSGSGLTKSSLHVMTKKRRKIYHQLLEVKRLLATTQVNRRLVLDNLFISLKYDI